VISDEAVERVLVVCAHPDDVDFAAAGTVATWTDAGIAVSYCMVTDGDAGGFDAAVSRSAMRGIRRAEQQAAAAAVGVQDVIFLGYPDGRLVTSLELRRDLTRVIRTIRPQRVLTSSPERNWQSIHASHPDHLAVGEAVLCAVFPDARNPFAHPELLGEGLEPHAVSEVWLMAGTAASRFVDVTDAFERKVAALRSHASQLRDPDAITAMVRSWVEATAERGGLAQGRLAEVFQVVDTS
jgi:LmbE family N-acetylglucosaminyl deacetylase